MVSSIQVRFEEDGLGCVETALKELCPDYCLVSFERSQVRLDNGYWSTLWDRIINRERPVGRVSPSEKRDVVEIARLY